MEGKGEPGAPKEEQRIDPYGKATREEIEIMLNRLMEINGISAELTVVNPPVQEIKAPESPSEPLNLGDVNGDKLIEGSDATDVLIEYSRVSTGAVSGFNEYQRTAANSR